MRKPLVTSGVLVDEEDSDQKTQLEFSPFNKKVGPESYRIVAMQRQNLVKWTPQI